LQNELKVLQHTSTTEKTTEKNKKQDKTERNKIKKNGISRD